MSKRVITELTPEQVARMAEYRDRWIQIGLSTEPACREKAEKAICAIYQSGGLRPPRKIVWCGSPLSQGLTRAVMLNNSVRASVRASVGASVRDNVRDRVWNSARDNVWGSVRDNVRDSVWNNVWASVRASVGASAWNSVWDKAWASARAIVGDGIRDSVQDSFLASGYGPHDASWLAFYEYFRQECRLIAQTEKMVGHFDQARYAGWYLPHRHICWVSERHNILVRDNRGRLHSESGPSVMYPDGWKIYAWHGVRVPESIIENRAKITVAQIIGESNTEIRRVMRNLYGNDRFMINAGAKEVDRCDKHGAALLAIHLPGDPVEIRMMRLTCPSTGDVYFERVPPDVRSAIDGLSWRFRVDSDKYQPQWES
jgi:hypothetical protein